MDCSDDPYGTIGLKYFSISWDRLGVLKGQFLSQLDFQLDFLTSALKRLDFQLDFSSKIGSQLDFQLDFSAKILN